MPSSAPFSGADGTDGTLAELLAIALVVGGPKIAPARKRRLIYRDVHRHRVQRHPLRVADIGNQPMATAVISGTLQLPQYLEPAPGDCDSRFPPPSSSRPAAAGVRSERESHDGLEAQPNPRGAPRNPTPTSAHSCWRLAGGCQLLGPGPRTYAEPNSTDYQ